MLLLSEYDIYKANYKWDDTSPYGQSWKDNSSIRTMLNGEEGRELTEGVTLKDCFQEPEIAAIMATINNEITEKKGDDLDPSDKINWYSNDYYAYGCGLTGDKLFLLSAKEAVNKEYGFGNINEDGANLYEFKDKNRIAKRNAADGSSSAVHWWLRSATSYSANIVAYVYSSGAAGNSSSRNTGVGVRFALNIPLSSIIFSSDANAESIVSSQLAPIGQKAQMQAICSKSEAPSEADILAGASKLTILDTSRESFQVIESTASAPIKGNVTLNYEGAKTGDNEFISIIIKNSAGEGLYYGTPKKVATAEDAAGTVEFTLPEDLTAGEYTVEVLNEQKNAAKETNYAGLDTVVLGVGKKAVLTATEETEGSGLWKVVATDDPNAAPLATFEGEGKTQTVVFYVPDTLTNVYLVDIVGNVSNAIPLNVDSSAPTAEVSYKNGTITVTVTDTEAGILSVDRQKQDPTEEAKGYPTKVTKGITKETTEVIVEDALGNTKEIPLTIDNTKPTIEKAYKNGTKAMIKGASDEGGAGLWKIVETNNADATKVYDGFAGTGDNLPKLFNLTNADVASVYAVDHAKNISVEVPLETDNTAPTGEVTYREGTITLAVTDSQSGIAKIGSTEYAEENYPASKDYIVTTGTASVEMVDALGNTATKAIDKDAPTPIEAFISNSTVTITATDKKEGAAYEKESGLWKVVDESDNVLYTYDTNDTIEPKTVTFTTTNTSLAKVCVVDHAGNKSAAIELKADNTAPTVTKGFISGKNVTITATDTESGLCKVLNATKDKVLYEYKESDQETVRFTITDEDIPLAKVYVVDKAGNETAKDLTTDTTAPTAERVYVKQ